MWEIHGEFGEVCFRLAWLPRRVLLAVLQPCVGENPSAPEVPSYVPSPSSQYNKGEEGERGEGEKN
jgi:hypothetical protein